MFSSDMKNMIATKVQKTLQETCHSELPKEEIEFLLHVDGAEAWSWANIRNNGSKSKLKSQIHPSLDKNTTVGK